jgi:transcriptional regulator with XRE-family HTH domain
MAGIEGELAAISQRVRRWREEKGLTLQQLAERSELAPSTVQKVETGQMIPSVAVLLKLARGLGRRMTELVHDADAERDLVHVPAAQRVPLGLEGKMMVERLSADLAEPVLEMWRVTLHPGVSSGRTPIHYDGEELALCERGQVTFVVDGEETLLRAGDTLHFKATLPHSWHNAGRAAARFLVVGTVPQQLRKAIQRRVAAVS